jgi:hypothetical protein
MRMFALVLAAVLSQQPPVPQPFPRPGAPQQPAKPAAPPTQAPTAAPATTPPATAAAPPAANAAPTETTLGVPIYPAAQFLQSYDAGRGQRFYVFGSTASFTDLVTWYRTALKQKGDLIFDAPATHEFDIGKFREDAMAFPPSVTIKEYKSEVSAGFPNPKAGGQPEWFPTLIQIVPAADNK